MKEEEDGGREEGRKEGKKGEGRERESRERGACNSGRGGMHTARCTVGVCGNTNWYRNCT